MEINDKMNDDFILKILPAMIIFVCCLYQIYTFVYNISDSFEFIDRIIKFFILLNNKIIKLKIYELTLHKFIRFICLISY